MNLELCRHCGRVIYSAPDTDLAPGWKHEHSNLYSCQLNGRFGAPYAEPEA